MKAVILCGGVGSRLRPLTETVPKPLIKLMNRPVIDIIIEKLISSGIDDISLSLGYKADEIADYCESRNFNADIKYFTEEKPLGTAGGVKFCVGSSDEDVIVLSGDNVFDFDINSFIDFHHITDADISVLSVQVKDPREYGVIISDDDGSIVSFIEKPTWEQADSFNINTGIYLLRGNILELIPNNMFYDFSNDLFPLAFKKELRFMSCSLEGFWGDIGEFEFLLSLHKKMLNDKMTDLNYTGTYYGSDTVLKNGAVIKAPCLIGKKTEIGDNAVIGPDTVCGENCSFAEKTTVSECVIGDGCVVGCSTEIRNAVIADNVRISDNCFIDKNSVIGESCIINRFSRVSENVRIWPGNTVLRGAVISKDMGLASSHSSDFDVFGMRYRLNQQIDILDGVQIGAAIGSVDGLLKIGVGSDSKNISENFRNSCICGIRSAGKICYDFGEMFKSQAYFFSAYCSLDFFLYFSFEDDKICISFFGKNAMPVNSRISREIENNLRYKAFRFADKTEIDDIYNMKLFGVVYRSFFRKILNTKTVSYNIYTESENENLAVFFRELFPEKNKKKTLTVLFNKEADSMFVIEEGKYYSSDRILALLCSYELAQGNKIIIPEYAPDFLENEAGAYSGELLRVYENIKCSDEKDNNEILQSVWTFDCVLMFAKLLSVIESTHCTLKELFDSQRHFEISKKEIEINAEPWKINQLITKTGAKKTDDEVYYSFESRKGSVRLRRLGNSGKIRILAQSFDNETAKELAGIAIKKIQDANIDKKG